MIKLNCRTCHSAFRARKKDALYCTPACRPSAFKSYKAPIGICGICSLQKKLFKDHNHDTGELRGLLCCRCNSLLGALDDKVFVLRAALYLQRFRPVYKSAKNADTNDSTSVPHPKPTGGPS